MLTEEEIREAVQRENPGATRPSPPGSALRIWAIVVALGAVVLCGFGIFRMYSYDYSDKIVGGDAYNYIIITNRAVGLICSAIVLMILSGVLALLSISKQICTR